MSETKHAPLKEVVTKGRNGWKYRVVWRLGRENVVWCCGDTLQDARAGVLAEARRIKLLNRPAKATAPIDKPCRYRHNTR